MYEMKRVKLKQGTLAWEKARECRIGSSEVFDIVRYYASDEELQNCGISAEKFKSEKPYTTAWALYHKILDDGIYHKEALPPELAEYGHAVEPYGISILQKNRNKKLKAAEVFISKKLIASLDIAGVVEDVDLIDFNYGLGKPKIGQRFVCEQKSMNPQVIKNGLPFKYIIQAQYQIAMTTYNFYILQLMILKEDTVFIRGKICQMSRKKKFEYLQNNLSVNHYYFKNNEHLSQLIYTCLNRFFDAVDNHIEPTAFIQYDSGKHILESIRINTYYNKDLVIDYDLGPYVALKEKEDIAKANRQDELQRIIELAKKFNVSKFASNDTTASFSKDGKFLLKKPKEKK